MHRFDLDLESSRDRPPAKGNASSYVNDQQKDEAQQDGSRIRNVNQIRQRRSPVEVRLSLDASSL